MEIEGVFGKDVLMKFISPGVPYTPTPASNTAAVSLSYLSKARRILSALHRNIPAFQKNSPVLMNTSASS